ncbi:MAG: Hpt domain-containing protein [Anaerolineales bacterium]|nr:Hpt domain-containing protein [Anaerolineales bacterium]
MSVLNMNVFNALKESVGADFIGELIDAFLDDAASQLDSLQAALRNNEAASFVRAAHGLKSNAATFGAEDLFALARQFEAAGREKNLEVGDQLERLIAAFESVREKISQLKTSNG